MSIVLKDDAMVLKVGFMVSNTHPIQLGDSRTLRVAFVFMQRWVRGFILPVTLLSILSHSHPVGSSGNQLSDCSEQVSLGSTPAGEAEVAQQTQVTAYRRCKEYPKEHVCLGIV